MIPKVRVAYGGEVAYLCNCPHCLGPQVLEDVKLWPDDGPEYPETSAAVQCERCAGWQRMVPVRRNPNWFEPQKCEASEKTK